MSKFKVGDKVVVCGGDIRTIARIDKWLDNEYGYYFNIDDELLNYYKEEDLELYKTPHERLLELGYTLIYKCDLYIKYRLTTTDDEGIAASCTLYVMPKQRRFSGGYHYEGAEDTEYSPLAFDKELAGILLQYLEELK